MAFFGWKKRCRQLEAENVHLQERNAWLEARNAEVEAENTRLVQTLAAAKKNSTTSSKPPSSDIVKPPPKKPGKGQRRKIGGQAGHPKHERPLFTPEQITEQIFYPLERCPVDPSHRLVLVPEQQRVLQQVELVKDPFVVTEHVGHGYWCEGCQQFHHAQIPAEVLAAGLCGPRLTSLVCYLKGKLHGSYSGMRDFFGDVLGIKVSRGYLAKLIQKASQAFAQPYAQLMDLLPAQAYKGILGADFWGAYRKYARQCHILIQFCLAHLIREVKYMVEFPEPSVQRYGKRLLAGLKALFSTLHQKAELSPEAFALGLATAQAQIRDAALAPLLHPRRYNKGNPHRLIQNMAQRFHLHGEGYFRFITSPEIDPTNNCVEQAMRFVVMDRHMTQGTRSKRGRDFCERLWTVMATCALQKRSAFAWMYQAICAHFNGRPASSLLLDSS